MALISPLYDQGDFATNLKEGKLFNSLKKNDSNSSSHLNYKIENHLLTINFSIVTLQKYYIWL